MVGIIRGLAMYFSENWFNLQSELALVNRVVVSTSSTIFWITIFAFTINSHIDYRIRYRSLISQFLLKHSVGITDKELKSKLIEVENSLRLIDLDTVNSSEEYRKLKQLADQVKNQIENSIKPLSKRLWVSAVHEYPHIQARRVVIDAVKQLSYSPLSVALLAAAISSFTLPTFLPILEALGRALVTFISLLIFGTLLKMLRRKSTGSNFLFSSLEFLIMASIPLFLADFIYGKNNFTASNPPSLVVYLIIPLFVLGLSIISLIKQDRQILLENIEKELENLEQVSYQRKQVASYLHNTLQSELLAISRKLEAAASLEDANEKRMALEQLGALINRSICDDFQTLYSSPRERLKQIQKNWHGIIDIEIDNGEALLDNENKAVVAIQLIEELASNIAKHSGTSRLDVSCYKVADSVFLEVSPFFEIDSVVKSGLGSEFIESFLSNLKSGDQDSGQKVLKFEI